MYGFITMYLSVNKRPRVNVSFDCIPVTMEHVRFTLQFLSNENIYPTIRSKRIRVARAKSPSTSNDSPAVPPIEWNFTRRHLAIHTSSKYSVQGAFTHDARTS